MLATGNAVNVAARLEGAARPPVRSCSAWPDPCAPPGGRRRPPRPSKPLQLKGKGAPVAAYRPLVRVRAPAPRPRAADAGAMVGPPRTRARAACVTLWRRPRQTAPAKSSTVPARCRRRREVRASTREFLAGIDGGRTVVRGTLPPLRRGDHVLAGRRGARATARVRPRCGHRRSPRPPPRPRSPRRRVPPRARRRQRGRVGRGDRLGGAQAAGGDRGAPAPLFVVLDDIHWGEQRRFSISSTTSAGLQP